MKQPKKNKKKKKRLVDYLDYGTPEYEKAYKEGRIQGQELDEVVVTSDARTGKNILEDYPFYNELSEQEKEYFRDSSPIGTQIRARAKDGEGVNAGKVRDLVTGMLIDLPLSSLQAPQSAMVEGVEVLRGNESDILSALRPGEQRVPSEVWGYENPESFWQNAANIGMDVVLDPSNIAGAGAVKSGLKQGVKVRKILPKLEQIPLDFKIEDVLKNISSTERKNMEIIEKGSAYFKELDNPESLKRLKEFGDEYEIDLLDAYKKAEKRWDYGTNIGKNDRFQVAGEEIFKDDIVDAMGVSTVNTEGIMQSFLSKANKGSKKDLSEHSVNYINKKASIEDYNTIVWHELSHDINKIIIGSSKKLQDDISNIFIKNLDEVNKTKALKAKEVSNRLYKSDWKHSETGKFRKSKSIEDTIKDELTYVSKPTETWAFLSTNLRQDLKNTGIIKEYNELLTPEKLEQAIKNGNTVFSRFEPYIKDKDNFIKLFNKMTLGITAAIATGAATQDNKENMATKKKKYRTGSGTQGVVRNYLPDPIESNAKADLLSAKADAEAFDNPFAIGLDMMAMYSGQIAQGLGSIKGAYGLEGKEQINVEGEEVVDDPTMGVMEMEGPSHDQGGIDMNVSPETDVFSDKVKDADGKSMADKKKKREKMKKALVKMLEEDHLDKARKNAYKRKLEQLEAEEEKDLTTQDQAGMFAELMGLPHTGEDGYAKYGMRKKMFTGKTGYNDEGEYEGYEIGDDLSVKSNETSDFGLPFQLGDVVKLAGNLHGMTSQMRNVKEVRAEDTPHPNHYKDVGRDAIATLEGSKGDLDAMGANQESRVRREASANKRRGRQSARGINQMRAMDAVSNMQTTMADMDIFDMIAKQKMGINQSIASTEMGASQAKAQGSAMARDLTDRDRHAYFTAKGSALGDMTKGLQQTGKDFNQMALNPVQMKLLEALGEHFYWDGKSIVRKKTE